MNDASKPARWCTRRVFSVRLSLARFASLSLFSGTAISCEIAPHTLARFINSFEKKLTDR